ncbi:MAG: succinylglutamate desuccinylase/aspartoacylase family protein [Myxococcota bacterium]
MTTKELTSPKRPAARAPFVFGRARSSPVRAGSKTIVDLPVARLPSGSWAHMPVAVVHGARPGPTAWISGAVHGDELNGIEIVRRVLRSVTPRKMRGTLLAIPIVNVFGVMNRSRYLPDRRDLNRSFPGSARGSMAARLARLFFDEVVARCVVGLDFHTGSAGRTNLPQLRCDLDDPETLRLARAFAAPVTYHAQTRDGSLRHAAVTAGVPTLLYEGGEAHRFDEDAVTVAVAGATRALVAMGMVDADDAAVAPATPTIEVRTSRWMRAGRAGFARIAVPLGATVRAGDVVALVADAFGSQEIKVRSQIGGIVIGALREPQVHRGDALVHVAATTG